MHNYMFRSRRGALVFAVLVILGAVSLVGTEDDSGTLTETSDDLARQKAAMNADFAAGNAVVDAESPEIYEDDPESWDAGEDTFLSDEELIDDTTGESTEPMVDTAADGTFGDDGGADEVILVTDE